MARGERDHPCFKFARRTKLAIQMLAGHVPASSARTVWCAANTFATSACSSQRQRHDSRSFEGAYEVLHGFEQVQHSAPRDAMAAITRRTTVEAERLARSALTLKVRKRSRQDLPITEIRFCATSFDGQPFDLWSHLHRVPGEPRQGGLRPPQTGASKRHAGPFKASTRTSG